MVVKFKELNVEQRAAKTTEINQTYDLFKTSVAHFKTFFPEIEQCKKNIVDKLETDKNDLFEAYDYEDDSVREDKLRQCLLPAISKYVKVRTEHDKRKKADKNKKDSPEVKKIQKTKDPKLLGPKLLDKKPNVENFVEYLLEVKPLDNIKEKKTIKKTVEIQRNKRFFLHNLLSSVLVPGKGHYCVITLTFLF